MGAARRLVHRASVVVATVALGGAGASAQEQNGRGPEADRLLRVFLDCDRCDFDHFRREVPFVDYVRDRADADLHVLVTSDGTGGGGEAYQLFFMGGKPAPTGRTRYALFRLRVTATTKCVRA